MKKSETTLMGISNFDNAKIPSNQLVKIQGGNNMREETAQNPPGGATDDD